MMNRITFLLLALMAAAFLVFAAACGTEAADDDTDTSTDTSSEDTSSGDTSMDDDMDDDMSDDMMTHSTSGVPIDPNARYGGTLLIATTSEGPTFSNWEEAAGSAPHYGHPVGNMLVSKQDWGTKENFINGDYWTIVPDLATDWEQAADGLTWTFNLRDGVEFSDGVAFTCADIEFAYDTLRTGDGLLRNPRSAHFASLTDTTCADDLTAVFHLERPKPSLLEVIGLPYHVVKPSHLYADDMNRMREEPPIGTGPFVVGDWIPGEKMVMERKDDYWDQPFPYLDSIEVLILNNQAQVAGLRSGRLHIGGSAGGWGGANADTLLRECDVCQKWASAVHPGMMFSVIPNFNREPWNTQPVRDAISLAIDRNRLIKLGYNDWIAPGTGGPFLPGSAFAMPEERLKAITGHDYSDPEANKARAREILAEAGYEPGELQATLVYAPFYGVYAPTVLEDLNDVGISVESGETETGNYYTRMNAGDFDLGGHAGWIGGFDPDFILYEYFYSGSGRNYGQYSNPELDRLIDAQSVELDPEQRRELAWQAGEIILSDQVRTMGGFQLAIPVFSDRVAGVMPTVPSQSYGNFYRHAHTYLLEDN